MNRYCRDFSISAIFQSHNFCFSSFSSSGKKASKPGGILETNSIEIRKKNYFIDLKEESNNNEPYCWFQMNRLVNYCFSFFMKDVKERKGFSFSKTSQCYIQKQPMNEPTFQLNSSNLTISSDWWISKWLCRLVLGVPKNVYDPENFNGEIVL